MSRRRFLAAGGGSRLALIGGAVAATGQELVFDPVRPFKEENRVRTRWIADVHKEIGTVCPGMTHGDLLKVFQEEGGISTRTQ